MARAPMVVKTAVGVLAGGAMPLLGLSIYGYVVAVRAMDRLPRG